MGSRCLSAPLFNMKTGILLIAFGRIGYMKMAFNMAKSLKFFSPDVKIALATDGTHTAIKDIEKYVDVFIPIEKGDPGDIKMSMYDLTPFENTLYLDVDGICIKDIRPLIDLYLKDGRPFISDVHGEGGINDDIHYSIWAKNKHIWAWFNLPIDAKFQGLQTSLVWFTKESKPLFDCIQKTKNFPKKFLTHKWGNSIPDELIFGGAAAKVGFDAKFTGRPIFFGNRGVARVTYDEMVENHYINSMYGNVNLVLSKYRRYYDQTVRQIKKDGGKSFLASDFINDKFVNHV
jgi:hypothetical protein